MEDVITTLVLHLKDAPSIEREFLSTVDTTAILW